MYLGGFAFLSILILVVWGNIWYSQEYPGGSEFLVKWIKIRSYIMEGNSPYSNLELKKYQDFLDNEPFIDGEISTQFISPFYATLLFSPFAVIGEYTFARGLWMTFLEVSLVVLAFSVKNLVGLKVRNWLLPIYLLFSFFWFPGFRGIIDGNISFFLALFIVIILRAVRDKNDMVVGFFLACITIKPKFMILFVAWILLWSISHRRWGLVRWFIVWLMFFIGLGMLFIPDWILQNIRVVINYPSSLTLGSVGNLFIEWWPGIGAQLKLGFMFLLVALLILEWWMAWRKDFYHLLWVACLTLTIILGMGTTVSPGDLVLLIFPVALILSIVNERWKTYGNWIAFSFLVLGFIGTWGIGGNLIGIGVQTHQYSEFFLLATFTTLIGLYWVRWWVIRPSRNIEGITQVIKSVIP
jgi:hypothetical protein